MKMKMRIRPVISNPYFLSAIFCICIAGVAYAATNIDTQDAGYKWGWNDVFGWVDMKTTATVMVTDTAVQGYASSSIGTIMFDCTTTPSGDSCATASWKTANDGTGLLSGWAWNDAIGWISMSGTTAGAENYQVRVDPAGDGINSYFHGWAWNDAVGWLTFNCEDLESLPGGGGFCLSNGYKTQTSANAAPSAVSAEFISSIFDIGTDTGIFNTLSWQGSQPAGSAVQFQIATASSIAALQGNMTSVFAGSSWFAASPAPASPAKLTQALTGVPVESRRYIRYKALLSGAGNSPRIDDILIGWSP